MIHWSSLYYVISPLQTPQEINVFVKASSKNNNFLIQSLKCDSD